MRRALPILLDTLYLLAIAVWLGGQTTFWLITVPAVKQSVPAGHIGMPPDFAWSDLAGWAVRCGITMLAVQFVQRRRYQRHRARFIVDAVRQLLVLAALMLAVVPAYHHAPADPSAARLSMALGFGQSALLIATVVMTVWLESPVSMPAPLPASKPEAAAERPARTTASPGRRRPGK